MLTIQRDQAYGLTSSPIAKLYAVPMPPGPPSLGHRELRHGCGHNGEF